MKKSYKKGPVTVWGLCTLTDLPDGSVIISGYNGRAWAMRTDSGWMICHYDLLQMDGHVKVAPSWLVTI